MPNLTYDYVTSLLNTLTSQFASSHFSLVLVSFFFSTLAIRAIMIGINQTYGQAETRSLLQIWSLSFLFILLFALAILLLVIAYLISADIGAVIFEKCGVYPYYYPFIRFFAVIFSWLASMFIFSLIYVAAPARPLKFCEGLPGALFSTLGLNIAFRVFTWFINHSNKYSTLYGNLGGLFALLVGFYFICVIINLGGKINLYWSLFKNNKIA